MRKHTKFVNLAEPLVSVIVPTYNRPDWLPITLNSLKNQTYKNIEIIVLNDAGTDVRTLVHNIGDNRIKYFFHSENKGLAASRNTAMGLATGDFFSWLDDDDIYLPLAIEFRMSQLLKRGVEIVYTRSLQNIYEPVQGGYKLSHQQLYWDSDFNRDKILVMNIAPCLCPLFSRRAWDLSGNYKLDENMTSSEDHDFWISLSRKTRFEELKVIDCECSYRTDKTQMTGSRNFVPNWVIMYKRWRNTAENYNWVVQNQNHIIRNTGLNPEDYGL